MEGNGESAGTGDGPQKQTSASARNTALALLQDRELAVHKVRPLPKLRSLPYPRLSIAFKWNCRHKRLTESGFKNQD